MTDRLISRPRRRADVSLSWPSQELHGGPVEQLDRAIECIHQANRALPGTALSREELVALGGLLTQASRALLSLTELLIAPVHHSERTRSHTGGPGAPAPNQQTATTFLRDCRSSYLDAANSARAFHANLKR